MKYTPFTTLAATYNCDSYGSGNYDAQGVCGVSTNNSTLTNTGDSVYVGLGAGVVLLAFAVALVFRARRKKQTR